MMPFSSVIKTCGSDLSNVKDYKVYTITTILFESIKTLELIIQPLSLYVILSVKKFAYC